jgi:hypothetical protein
VTFETLDEPADWDRYDHKARRERTDEHRPSVINPADYEYVAQETMKWEGIESSEIIISERARIKRHMEATGGTYSRHQHGGNCHICGSVNAIYTHLFYHKPSNTYVRTGEDCAQKLDASVDGAEFRAKVNNAIEAAAGKRKAQAVLVAAGVEAAWQVYVDPCPVDDRGNLRYEENTISDIVGKLVRYGSASPAQLGFVGKLLVKIANRAQIEADRAAERAAAMPFPTEGKRRTVRGEIVSIKPPPEYFGGERPRMLVKAIEGWMAFGTLPISLDDAKRGDKVEFDALLKPSDKDPKFGFISRPTKARFLTA